MIQGHDMSVQIGVEHGLKSGQAIEVDGEVKEPARPQQGQEHRQSRFQI